MSEPMPFTDAGLPEPSPGHPVYKKIHQGDDASATRLFMITCDEGWRTSIICCDVYEHVADWLLGILGRQPYAKTPGEARQ